MKNKVLIIFLVALTGLFLVGCTDETDGDAGGDVVTLTMWNRYPELNDAFEEFIVGFEEEHQEIKVDLQNIPVNAQAATYQSAIAENNLPDIWTTATVSLDELVKLDRVKNLNELFTEEIKDQYFPGAWFENGTTLNGDVYVFPLYSPNHGVNMMFYNKDVLSEYGISESDIPTTWEEMIEIGEKIFEESNGSTYGFIYHNAPWAYNNFIYTQSTAISAETPWEFNLKDGKPDYSNPGNIEAIEFLKSLYDENIMEPSSIEIDPPVAEANLAAGQAAFYIGGNWTGGNLINAGFENWDVVPLPTKDGSPVYAEAAREENGLMVNNETEHWEEVKIFLEYAFDHVYSEVILGTGATQPAKMNVEGDHAFPQLENILTIMTETAVPVPKPEGRSLETIDFIMEYDELRGFEGIGNVAIGYLAGNIDDLELEINELNDQANEAFDSILEESPNVSRELFQFPNWEPFTPYMEEDYKELE